MSLLQILREEASRHGLTMRCTFTPHADDAVPPVAEGMPARTLALLGNTGSSLWPAFSASPEFGDGRADPLDRWSRRIGEELAVRCGGRALFPFGGPPHHPFQRWALRSGVLFESPVGILVDPQYGSWHAFRFAIALPEPVEEIAPAAVSPCLTCSGRPCLNACPVGAFVEGEYRHAQCVDYLVANPNAECWRSGCIARQACPVGQAHRYPAEQAQFHMSAFVANLRRPA